MPLSLSYALGDALNVRLVQVDTDMRRINFEVAENITHPPETRTTRSSRDKDKDEGKEKGRKRKRGNAVPEKLAPNISKDEFIAVRRKGEFLHPEAL